MSDEVSVKVEDAQVRRAFDQLKLRAQPAGQRQVLSAFGRYGKSSTQQRFRTQVGPDGIRWRPSRRAEREGGQTLRKTSRLRNSIEWDVDTAGVAWGTNVAYAKVHQFGYVKSGQRVRGHERTITEAFGQKLKVGVPVRVAPFARRMNIPARAFLGVNEADRAALLSIAREHLERGVAR